MWRTILATTAVLVAGVATIVIETDGLAAFTTEGARRLAVTRAPVPVPSVRLRDERGEAIEFPVAGRAMLVEFVYTSCPTLCVSLAQAFARIRDDLERAGADPVLRLLSVSFDPARDDPPALRAYAEAHGADRRRWRVAVPETEADLRSLLETFGVIVIADGEGGFVHNAALHLVDAEGRLAAIFDPDEGERAAQRLLP
ncbi:MAG: SCO family protein [Geminicoccaceae bacterium]|nr:SCO family protein [Geminicoccaceae bacterium]MCS7268266.1 SCO family protein [Geminicoccaceae bacterium]MDW8125130.1 SCO family protein [Geminicoccaceae bacterium]MDW8340905.1 SCO family protein [Geminicoccaceae bacterium]